MERKIESGPTPQFKIHGLERKNLKKVLSTMKQSLNGIITEHDVNQIYGINYPEDYLEQVDKLKKDIHHMETILSETHPSQLQQ